MKKWLVYYVLVFLPMLLFVGCSGRDSSVSPPATVGSVVVTPADSQVTVTWSPVAGATRYEVFYNSTNASNTAEKFTGDSNDTDTTCTITGLTNGVPCYVWVNAINSAGSSGFSSSSSSGTPTAAVSIPSPPAAPAVTAGDGTVTLTWAAVSGATSYKVYYGTTDNSVTATEFAGDANATDTTCIITGLTNGTIYYVWIKAANSAGSSAASSVSSGTPAATVTIPAAPAALSVVPGDSQVTVTWSAVSGATSYKTFYNTANNSTTATEFTGDGTTSDTTCTITGLTNGTPYYVWVQAANSAGTSNFSPAAAPATPVGAFFTVNAATGDDTNGNGTMLPYKTITKALSVAVSGASVTVAPGTYDAALGEIFPIIVPAGVSLIGDEANKGNGSTATTIIGGGNAAGHPTFISAAIVPMDNTVVAGFVITGTAPSPVVQHPMGFIVEHDTVKIRNNRVVNSGKTGIYFFGGGTNCLVAGNVIQSNGVDNNGGGIAFVNGTGPGVRIENNIIRLNVYGVEYDAPATSGDLGGGTQGSAGGNIIAGNFNIDLWTDVDAGVTISARNNFWSHVPLTSTASSTASGFDLYNKLGATVDTTGAALVP